MIVAFLWYKLSLNFIVHLEYIMMNHDLFITMSKQNNVCVRMFSKWYPMFWCINDQQVIWCTMFCYLQFKAVEEFEEIRNSLEVQKLCSQKKPAHHHVHVLLCSGEEGKCSTKLISLNKLSPPWTYQVSRFAGQLSQCRPHAQMVPEGFAFGSRS